MCLNFNNFQLLLNLFFKRYTLVMTAIPSSTEFIDELHKRLEILDAESSSKLYSLKQKQIQNINVENN